MKKLSLLVSILITFLFFNCQSKMNSDEKIDVLYNLQLKENNQIIDNLEETINKKINNSINLTQYDQINKCDSLSKEYFNYLESVENVIKEKGFQVFFVGDEYSKFGKEYISNSEKYIKGIENLMPSKNLLERINITLNTKDVKNENDFYIKYLDYYFKGFPKSQSTAFINGKIKEILTFENELIDELIIKSK